MRKKVFIAGGTGFVGVNLANRLLEKGYWVTVMGQLVTRPRGLAAGVGVVSGDGRIPGPWQREVAGCDTVINLAGASIFTRWNEEKKRLLRESRILTTRHIVEALPEAGRPSTLFSTSAVGYYGAHGDGELDEESPPGEDFIALLCRDWEAEAGRAVAKGIRVVITRFGIVLGRHGGALGQMLPMFRMFLGGPLGSGQQWFSWIHMEDLLEAFLFLLEKPEAAGPYNFTSPSPVRNRELAGSLGKVLRRPALLPAPAFIIRLIMGEFGGTLLEGQRVRPGKLLGLGYRFSYPEIGPALAAAVSG